MFVYLLAFLFISTLGINADATECENTTDDNIIDGMVQVTPEYVQNLIDAFQYRTYEIATTSLSPGTYTLYTTNNTPVEAIVYEPMSSYEVAAYLDLYFEYSQYLTFYVENDGDALITNAYNCHYYAWCSDWCENQYLTCLEAPLHIRSLLEAYILALHGTPNPRAVHLRRKSVHHRLLTVQSAQWVLA